MAGIWGLCVFSYIDYNRDPTPCQHVTNNNSRGGRHFIRLLCWYATATTPEHSGQLPHHKKTSVSWVAGILFLVSFKFILTVTPAQLMVTLELALMDLIIVLVGISPQASSVLIDGGNCSCQCTSMSMLTL